MTPAVKLLEKNKISFKSIPTSTIRLKPILAMKSSKIRFESGSGLQNAAGGSERCMKHLAVAVTPVAGQLDLKKEQKRWVPRKLRWPIRWSRSVDGIPGWGD